MILGRLIKSIRYFNALTGLLMVLAGINIMIYGELRSLIVLANERYLVGGVFVIVGIIVLFMEVKSAAKKISS